MARSLAVGFSVEESIEIPGTLRVHSWLRTADRPSHPITDDYDGLTYTEAVDVILALVDQGRPGWEWHPDGHQPPLWPVG